MKPCGIYHSVAMAMVKGDILGHYYSFGVCILLTLTSV